MLHYSIVRSQPIENRRQNVNGIIIVVLSWIFIVGAGALFVQNQGRIKRRSFGAFMMFVYALLFGMTGTGALTISTFDPTSNPTAQWYALIAYASCLSMGFGGTWFMFRKRQ